MAYKLVAELRERLARHPPGRRLYMSQTNQADGYPFVYPQYTEAQRKQLRQEKVALVVRSGLENAQDLDCRYFLSYAGHATAFVRNPPDELDRAAAYMPVPEIIDLAAEVAPDVTVLDCRAGDRFDFERVEPLLGVRLRDEDLAAATRSHYSRYGQIAACDTFRFQEPVLSAETRQDLLTAFVTSFNSYVCKIVEEKHFRCGVLGKTVALGSIDDTFCAAVEMGTSRIHLLA